MPFAPFAFSSVYSIAHLLILYTFYSVFYAVWKSSLYPAAQGRLSIAISEKYPPDAAQGDTMRRGWWDYVPRAPASENGSIRQGNGHTGHGNANHQPRISEDSIVRRLRNSVLRFTAVIDPQQQVPTYTRKPSIPTDQPLSQPPRPSAPSPPSEKEQLTRSARYSVATISEAATSGRTTSIRSINFTPSAMSETSSRIGPLQPAPAKPHDRSRDTEGDARQRPESIQTLKLLPRIFQVRAVIKDEVCRYYFHNRFIPHIILGFFGSFFFYFYEPFSRAIMDMENLIANGISLDDLHVHNHVVMHPFGNFGFCARQAS